MIAAAPLPTAPTTAESAAARCPYPGLRAFFTDERDWYFGREAHVDAMLTRLETNQFLAVVGSSGSGKSSLVFAGLIPALAEGQLAGSRRVKRGGPAPWRVVSFHPGNDPLEALAEAIVQAAERPSDLHLAGYVRASLISGEQGLIEALRVAGLLDEEQETLVYADQFEELFRFGEKSSRAEQENALRFAQLLVAAGEQTSARVHLLLSMRSEFIGECERFPGLPELVSRSQFLTPRLSRKQLEQSLSCPAATEGWKIAPDALTAILNDCGNSPDQLPLAQHVLRRMWLRAGADGRTELTLEDYRAIGGIRNSVAQHGEEILGRLREPDGQEVARILFMALCDQREEGPLVRRLSTEAEVEAIALDKRALVPAVIAAFCADDPGFIRKDKGWLDVRHEAVLRQWPRIAGWRTREVEAEKRLHEIAQAAAEYERMPKGDLWRGNRLARAEAWMLAEKPSGAWARRHGVQNWEQCLGFLKLSRQSLTVGKYVAFALLAAVLIALGFTLIPLWLKARRSQAEAVKAQAEAVEASEKRLELVKALANLADDLSGPILKNAQTAVAEEEQKTEQLITKIAAAADGAPPDDKDIEELKDAREAAQYSVDDVSELAGSIGKAAPATKDEAFTAKAKALHDAAAEVEERHLALRRNPRAQEAITRAMRARLERSEAELAGLLGTASPDPALVQQKDAELLAATANLAALEAIRDAGVRLGFEAGDFLELMARAEKIQDTVAAARAAKVVNPAESLTEWTQQRNAPAAIDVGGKVNRVRFLPAGKGKPPLIAIAAADGKAGTAGLWGADGHLLGQQTGSSALNDIALSPSEGEERAAALASNGSTVRVLRWAGANFSAAKMESFTRHSDSVTDVEFSHGGERIASASADRTVRVFDAKTLAQLYFSSPPLPGIVTSVMFHPKDNMVVSGCDDGGVRLHSIPEPSVTLLGKMDAPARRPEFSADGTLILAASGDKTARVWTLAPPQGNQKTREILKIDHAAPVMQATFRPVADAAKYAFITCASSGELRQVRFSKDDGVNIEPLEPRHPGAALSASWGADGTRLATVGGGEVLVWKWTGDRPVARLRISGVHAGTSRAEFSADGRWLATYGGDSVALVWDLSRLAE